MCHALTKSSRNTMSRTAFTNLFGTAQFILSHLLVEKQPSKYCSPEQFQVFEANIQRKMKLSETGFSWKPKKLRIIIKLSISYFENRASQAVVFEVYFMAGYFSSSSAVIFGHLKISQAIENKLYTSNSELWHGCQFDQ